MTGWYFFRELGSRAERKDSRIPNKLVNLGGLYVDTTGEEIDSEQTDAGRSRGALAASVWIWEHNGV
jgi:hypothetical protein